MHLKSLCTISCRKKNIENRLSCECTLAATSWLRCGPGPTRHFVDQHVPKEIGACGFAAGEEVFRRRRDKCVWTDLETLTATWTQPPEGSSMGEGDGVHKRRMFRWPK